MGEESRLSWRLDPEASFSDWTIVVRSSKKEDNEEDAVCDVRGGPDKASKRARLEEEEEPSRPQRYDGSCNKADTYHVHRNVIGIGPRKSEYFSSLWQTKFTVQETEDSTSRIDLDPKAAEEFPAVLDFMYFGTEEVNITPDNAVQLYQLADYFGIQELSSFTVDFIRKDLPCNFLMYAEEALACNADAVLESTVESCARHFSSLDTAKISKLPPEVLNEILSCPEFRHSLIDVAGSSPGTYIQNHENLNAEHRALLVDWLISLHAKHNFGPESLYLCVNIVDRYCRNKQIIWKRYLLVGIAALCIATKNKEYEPMEAEKCAYLTARISYGEADVLAMEQEILQSLEYRVSVLTAYSFLSPFLDMTKALPLMRFAAQYYLDRMLQEHDLLEYKPGLVCAASVVLALNNSDIREKENMHAALAPGVPALLLKHTGFHRDEIIKCANVIARKILIVSTSTERSLTSVREKYDVEKYRHVSTAIAPPAADVIV